MKTQSPVQRLSPLETNKQKGAILIISVIIISAILCVVLIEIAFSSIIELQVTDTATYGVQNKISLDGCAEEALIKLNRNNAYAGETIAIDAVSCVITISGTGNTRTITIVGTLNNYSETLKIDTTLIPFSTTKWY